MRASWRRPARSPGGHARLLRELLEAVVQHARVDLLGGELRIRVRAGRDARRRARGPRQPPGQSGSQSPPSARRHPRPFSRLRQPGAARRSRRARSRAPNTAVPATKTSAPARAAAPIVSGPMPPSTSSATSRPRSSIQRRSVLDLAEHARDELLAAEARVDRHHQHLVDVAEHRLDACAGRRRVQHHAGARAGLADLREGAVQVRAGLDVDADGRRRRRARSPPRSAPAPRSSGARRAAARSSASPPARSAGRS